VEEWGNVLSGIVHEFLDRKKSGGDRFDELGVSGGKLV
jgi:hypothetical protein